MSEIIFANNLKLLVSLGKRWSPRVYRDLFLRFSHRSHGVKHCTFRWDISYMSKILSCHYRYVISFEPQARQRIWLYICSILKDIFRIQDSEEVLQSYYCIILCCKGTMMFRFEIPGAFPNWNDTRMHRWSAHSSQMRSFYFHFSVRSFCSLTADINLCCTARRSVSRCAVRIFAFSKKKNLKWSCTCEISRWWL
jgi:hypothetical protein